MDAAELDAFIEEASQLAKARSAEATRDFGLGGYARYHLDLAAPTATFFAADNAPIVTARAMPVGTWERTAQSWQWSWGNDSIPEAVSQPMLTVMQFGEAHDVAALRGPFAPCSEELAWALAAISLKLLDAQCIYRVEQPKTLLFLLLVDINWTSTRPMRPVHSN